MDRLTKRVGREVIIGNGEYYLSDILRCLADYEDEAEQREKGCEDCNDKKSICYTKRGIKKEMKYCATCGRKLGE